MLRTPGDVRQVPHEVVAVRQNHAAKSRVIRNLSDGSDVRHLALDLRRVVELRLPEMSAVVDALPLDAPGGIPRLLLLVMVVNVRMQGGHGLESGGWLAVSTHELNCCCGDRCFYMAGQKVH